MRLTVYINPPKDEALLSLARQERRRPSDQAALLIERALADSSRRAEPREVADARAN